GVCRRMAAGAEGGRADLIADSGGDRWHGVRRQSRDAVGSVLLACTRAVSDGDPDGPVSRSGAAVVRRRLGGLLLHSGPDLPSPKNQRSEVRGQKSEGLLL